MFRNVANYFRLRLRHWLRIVDPPAQETVVQEAKRKGISIASALLQRAGEKIEPRKVAAPALPRGVVPDEYKYDKASDPGNHGPYLALDDAVNTPMYDFANAANCSLAFPGYAYLAELTQRSEYRAPSETISTEMTREWIEIIQKGKKRKNKSKPDDADTAKDKKPAPTETNDEPDAASDPANMVDEEMEAKLEEIEEALKEFKIRALLQKMAQDDGFFGRGQLYIDIDQKRTKIENDQLPLVIDEKSIAKGSLKGFKAIEPMWTTPYTYNATDPTAPDFYVPQAWFVMGRRIHATRILTFIMREVPDMLKPAYNFSGLSMTQLMEPYVFQWLRTRNSVSDLIYNFSIVVLKTDMSAVLEGEDRGVSTGSNTSLLDRAKLFTANRANQGLMLADKDREELEMLNVPLGSLDALQAQAQEHMAAPSHIPLVKLLGISPGGLNASSEGEIEVFYDFVRACQQAFYSPRLDIIIKIIQLHLYGEIDDSITYEYIPLSSPTVKELSEVRKADAETAQTYVSMGAIAPDEVRSKLRSDPMSGYNSINGPPPEAPDMEAMQTQHELGEESAANAHERNLETIDKTPTPGAKK